MKFEIAGDLESLDKAIAFYRDAVDSSRGAPPPDVLSALGTALAIRYEFSDSGATLDEAIATLEAALKSDPLHDKNNLAIALLHRHERSRRRRDLNRAIELLTSQLEWDGRSPGTLNNFATALLRRGDVQLALAALREALSSTPPGSPDRPGLLSNLLGALTLAPQSRSVVGEGRRLIAEVRTLPLDLNPGGVLEAVRNWGNWTAGRGDWAQAAIAFGRGMDVLDNLLQQHSSADRKTDWIARVSGIAFDAAYAHARRGEIGMAALAFERGRGILLREGTERVLGHTLPTVRNFEDLQRAAEREPLVLIGARKWGGVAIIVRGKGPAQAIWLPKLTEGALGRQVGRYLAAYTARDARPNEWDAAIVRTTRWLWNVAMGRVTAAALGPRAIVVAAGGLGILPLHAAWTTGGTGHAPKKFVLDSVALTFVPSVAALLLARSLVSTTVSDTMVAVADPSAPGQIPLPAAVEEVTLVARHFRLRTLLVGHDATREGVLGTLRRHSIWHFACHGFAAYDMADAGLIMAGGDVLTLRDFLGLGSIDGHVRLAVMSACETAVLDGRVPDEVVSLPSAMLRIGVPNAVGSLWSVPAGLSTALLFARFYELWRDEHMDLADALREAQCWTRDSTNAEKHARFPQLVTPGAHVSEEDLEFWGNARPHRAPYFWAPFVLVGA